MKYHFAGALSLIGAVSAQQALYGQCGGINWTGPTTCVAGSYCQYSNDWYSQCVPGKSSAVASSTRSSTTTTRSSTAAVTSKSTSSAAATSKTSSVAAGTSATTTKTSSVPVGTSTAIPSRSGTSFVIDGKKGYFAGTNSYWIGFLTYNPDVDAALDHIAAAGIKILRVWGFNDVTTVPAAGTVYFQYLSAAGSTINTGADGLQRLDYVVDGAAKRGIKLIINFVNNWGDYGGMPAYVTAFGGTKESWYNNTAAQAQYQKYIAAVVSRYKTSSAVFAWELANEPRCNQCDTSVVYNWAVTISKYIKSLDPNHMVTLGDEGFGLAGDGSYPYQFGEGLDFAKNLAIPTIDFGTFHLYPNSWGTSYDWGNGWIQSHGAACVAAGKPCLFEEYGAPSNHCAIESPWQKTAIATAGVSGDAFWDFGDTLPGWGKTSDDGNTIFTNTDDWTCLVTNHIADIQASAKAPK